VNDIRLKTCSLILCGRLKRGAGDKSEKGLRGGKDEERRKEKKKKGGVVGPRKVEINIR
jgi:hypothetical protein